MREYTDEEHEQVDKEDIDNNEKGFIIDKSEEKAAEAYFVWDNYHSMYNVENGTKIDMPKLSNKEKERLAVLKMCPDHSEIKGIGYSTSLVYGVIRDE